MSSSLGAFDTALARLKELESLIQSNSGAEDKPVRQQASALARKLWLELEEPGDLIDRIVYQVRPVHLYHNPKSTDRNLFRHKRTLF